MIPPSGAVTDYLTCGGCSQEFPLQCIASFIHHKASDCPPTSLNGTTAVLDLHLSCFHCAERFLTARGLLFHVQSLHKLQIIAPSSSLHPQLPTTPPSPGADLPDPPPPPSQGRERRDEGDTRYTKFQFGDTRLTISREGYKGGLSDNNDYVEVNSSGGMICCNSAECCVTIIPGTHEEPRKCCSAIVPKKRKRHMEDHMGEATNDGAPDNGREGNDSDGDLEYEEDREKEEENRSHSVYINVGRERRSEDAETPWSEEMDQQHDSKDALPSLSWSQRLEDGERGCGPGRGPVIMQPGYTYSIPLSFSLGRPQSSLIQYQQASLSSLTITDIHSQPRLQTGQSYSHASSHAPSHTMSRAEMEGSRNQSMGSMDAGEDSCSMDFAQPECLTSHDEQGEVASQSREMGGDWGGSEEDRGASQDHDQDQDGGSRAANRRRRYPTSKPYKCEQCDHAFNQRIHLKKHMSKHTGVKPFKCEQCDYSTVERSHLKVHIRIHTGEKPFKCTYCEYATAQNSTLKIHLKRHHSGRMFECSICPKKFTQQEMLASHSLDHQPGLP